MRNAGGVAWTFVFVALAARVEAQGRGGSNWFLDKGLLVLDAHDDRPPSLADAQHTHDAIGRARQRSAGARRWSCSCATASRLPRPGAGHHDVTLYCFGVAGPAAATR